MNATTKLTTKILIKLPAGATKKVKLVSRILVYADTVLVAAATLGGRYTEVSALRELRLYPDRFKKYDGYPICKTLNLC